jgi:predicted O-linked N-acetylglucosamine transferase (SPINDLY family)
LKSVDQSVLWLVIRSPLARQNLTKAATSDGVDPSRLVFTGFVPMEQHLARLRLADLFLDTMVYNGGATTSNALWAGVPVLSILGRHWVSRMSASALSAIGLKALITKNLDEYQQKAIALALDPPRLKALRQRLWDNRKTEPLFNTALFTRHFENAFHQMWHRHLDGQMPASIEVKP